MPEVQRKMTAGCTVECSHNKKGQCDLPQMSKGLMLADERCADYGPVTKA